MQSKTEIVSIITARLHTLISEGNIHAARTVFRQLNAKGIQTPELETLRAWFRLKTLQHTTRELSSNRTDPSRWLRQFESLWALKREREAVEVLLEGLQQHPQEVEFHRRLVSQYTAAGAYEAAFAHSQSALEINPLLRDMLERQAHLAVINQHEHAASFIDQMMRESPNHWLAAHQHYLRLTQPEHAERILTEARDHYPDMLGPQIGLAKMALWKGNTSPAFELAPHCINSPDHQAQGYALLGIAHVVHRSTEAEIPLQKACDLDLPTDSIIERSELFCARALNALDQSRWNECATWCDAAISKSKSGHPFAYLLRIIAANHGLARPRTRMNPRWFSHMEEFAPVTGPVPDTWKHDYTAFYDVFLTIREKLQGNFSSTPTWVEDGAFQGLVVSGLQHHELRFGQQRIRVQNTDDLWETFEHLIRHHPEDPQTYTYSGEVLLWVGRYAEAETLFRKALRGSFITIWTWIGLGAALGYQGRYEEAFEVFEEGIRESDFEGPTVFVYRGEFLRKLGRLDQARRDLTIAVQQKPNRLSGWINRVLVDHALGEPEPARILCAAIRQHCSSLWWDARAQSGADPFTLHDLDRTLETMLDMMLGNRSSTILTYKCGDHPLRGIRWKPDDVPTVLCTRYGLP